MTIKELIEKNTASLIEIYPKSEAVYILKQFVANYLECSQAKLILKQVQDAPNGLERYVQKIMKRLLHNEPFQYILGFENFYGYDFKVNSAVLIPRPETEELVALVLDSFSKNKKYSGIDIGTGTACIPIAIQKERPLFEMKAVDVSSEALRVAQSNNELNKTRVVFEHLDILDEKLWKENEKYDFVVSNPPYIPNKEKELMHDNVLNFEPHLALFVADDDAIIFYSKIADFAVLNLKPSGLLFFECNEFNVNDVQNMLKEKTFKNIIVHKDMQGKDRMIKASLI